MPNHCFLSRFFVLLSLSQFHSHLSISLLEPIHFLPLQLSPILTKLDLVPVTFLIFQSQGHLQLLKHLLLLTGPPPRLNLLILQPDLQLLVNLRESVHFTATIGVPPLLLLKHPIFIPQLLQFLRELILFASLFRLHFFDLELQLNEFTLLNSAGLLFRRRNCVKCFEGDLIHIVDRLLLRGFVLRQLLRCVAGPEVRMPAGVTVAAVLVVAD